MYREILAFHPQPRQRPLRPAELEQPSGKRSLCRERFPVARRSYRDRLFARQLRDRGSQNIDRRGIYVQRRPGTHDGNVGPQSTDDSSIKTTHQKQFFER